MDLSVRAEHLKRYKEIAVLLVKYGRVDMVDSRLQLSDTHASLRTAENVSALLSDLERLGPTFIRIGQWLSMRSDLLPPAYLEGLSGVVQRPKPMEFAEVERVMSRDLDLRIAKGFRQIDPLPLKVDAIGQMHRAVLRDNREVAVKVQRPGIRGRVFSDLDAMQKAAEFLDRHTDFGARYRFRDMLQEFRSAVLNELDFRQEAFNTQILKDNSRHFRRFVIPAHLEGYTTSTVLTLQLFKGTMLGSKKTRTEGDAQLRAAATDLVGAYLQQILLDGFYDADPRIEEFYLMENYKIAMTALGAAGRIPPNVRKSLHQMILAVSDCRAGEVSRLVCSIALNSSQYSQTSTALEDKISIILMNSDVSEDTATGTKLLQIAKVAADCNVRVPTEFLMAARTLSSLDCLVRSLDSAIDVNALIRQKILEIFADDLAPSVAEKRRTFPASSPLSQADTQQSSAHEKDSDNSVDARTGNTSSLQSIADRITLGVILSALIIGAALLVEAKTGGHYLDIPERGIALFAVLASGGLGFVSGVRARKK